jgi:hypothetical protein
MVTYKGKASKSSKADYLGVNLGGMEERVYGYWLNLNV